MSLFSPRRYQASFRPYRPCTWHRIYEKSTRMGREDRLLEVNAPLDKRNLLDKVRILAGLIPLKSARAAQFMAGDVPGVVIPESMVKRMTDAEGKEAQQAEGFRIALEILEKLKTTQGISGVHIMAVHWESIIPDLVADAGLPTSHQSVQV